MGVKDVHIDYIPTQVVAEYLSKQYVFRVGETEISISAIIFNSAQRKKGVNIAILGEAAHVAYLPKRSRSVGEAIDNDFIDSFIGREQDLPFSASWKPRGVKISDTKVRTVKVKSAEFDAIDGDEYDVGLDGFPI
jgi:hypothetical protein